MTFHYGCRLQNHTLKLYPFGCFGSCTGPVGTATQPSGPAVLSVAACQIGTGVRAQVALGTQAWQRKTHGKPSQMETTKRYQRNQIRLSINWSTKFDGFWRSENLGNGFAATGASPRNGRMAGSQQLDLQCDWSCVPWVSCVPWTVAIPKFSWFQQNYWNERENMWKFLKNTYIRIFILTWSSTSRKCYGRVCLFPRLRTVSKKLTERMLCSQTSRKMSAMPKLKIKVPTNHWVPENGWLGVSKTMITHRASSARCLKTGTTFSWYDYRVLERFKCLCIRLETDQKRNGVFGHCWDTHVRNPSQGGNK